MDVQYHEEYVRNPRGVQLFTCGWLPASSSPKALVFLCHGYGMECSDFMRERGIYILYEDVKSCQCEDVHVLWSILVESHGLPTPPVLGLKR
nr:unnamed protein product [Digitaria exilis]